MSTERENETCESRACHLSPFVHTLSDCSAAHYTEMFRDDAGEWGWQCYGCRKEVTGLPSLSAAEDAAVEHQAAGGLRAGASA